MSALKRIPPVQLTLMVVVVVALALAVGFKLAARAQEATEPVWRDADIGAAPVSGGVQANGSGAYILSSSGADIWGAADSFHFMYQPLGTNGQLVARVVGIQGTNDYAKAGVMIRESLEAGSRNAAMLLTMGGRAYFQWRSLAGCLSQGALGSTNATTSYWVKIVRRGDWMGGYSSADGSSWALVGWQTFNHLAAQVYVGLAASPNWEGSPATVVAAFDQVNVSAADAAPVTWPVTGSGDGLLAHYYDNRHLSGQPVTNRVEAQLDVHFLAALQESPTNTAQFAARCQALLGMPKAHEFSVCWSGELEAQFSEPYTLYMLADDGARVWLNEQLIIDDWVCHPAKSVREQSASVNLVAGQRYLLRVAYFRNHGFAQAHLSWSSPSTPKQIVPQSQLYSQPADADGNGLPDLWEEHYFGQTGVDPNADPDGDGLSNLQEYQRHTEPANPQTWGVPDGFAHGDIGGGNTIGRASYTNGVFSVSSASDEIWGNADSFHYVFQPLGTNGQFIARLLGVQGTNQHAKAGVMIRESLDDNARNAMVMARSNTVAFQWRETAGGPSQQPRAANGAAPYWVKVVRSGDWVGGYYSPDGTSWTLLDWAFFRGLAPQVYVGLALSAHDGPKPFGRPATAQFDQVSTGPADPAEIVNVAEGHGDGLWGNYRNDSLLYLPGIASRVDKEVDFSWPHQPPMSGQLNPDSYGVCWSGELEAQFSEPHTFSLDTRREDWVRLWINEQLVIDGWRSWHPDGVLQGSANLVAGQHYLIRVEMFNHLGHGKAILKWASPSMSRRIIPQSQLYSQPVDSDGNGLPDLWQMIYFGHTGVDPNADPDGDGLSNLQEYRYHTNPLKADTDGDGLPDGWEVAHGLDPQFNDANLDYDNAGLSNLQKYLYGLDPFVVDSNGDGLPDSFEEEYLGTGPGLVCTNQVSVVATVSGAQATNYLGRWQVEGNDIYALDRRAGLDFVLPVASADKYVLNLVGTQNQFNPRENRFKLLLSLDGQRLGNYFLNAGYGTNGTVELVLPYLQAGSHTLRVFWDGVASYSSLRIKQVRLLSVSGTTSANGLKDWVQRMVGDQSGLDNTNVTITSYTSPLCLEGRDPYPAMMQMSLNQTNALVPTATSDGHWYVNVPLLAETQAVVQVGFQNGALAQSRNLQWLPVNLLAPTNLTIRLGESLLFTAVPTNGANGNLQVTIGTNCFTSTTARPVRYRFTTPGQYTITGTCTLQSGTSQSGSITVNVVQQNLPTVEPAAWTEMQRALVLASLAPEAVLQADSRLTCFLAATNANGRVRLALDADANEPRSLLARLGAGGPVLDSTQVQGFDVWSGNQAYTRVLEVYPDGSQRVEMLVIASPVQTNVTFTIECIAGGVMFEDGTTLKTLSAADFDALGQCPVRFFRPASAVTSVCNSIKAYQGKYQIGCRK